MPAARAEFSGYDFSAKSHEMGTELGLGRNRIRPGQNEDDVEKEPLAATERSHQASLNSFMSSG
jgi:hypothetical protein